MTIELLFLLAAVTVIVVLVAVLFIRLARRWTSQASESLTRLATTLDDRAQTLPRALSSARATLAERGAAAEHALWLIGRFDERVDQVEHALAQRRAGLDATRARLVGARAGVQRLKSALRLIMRAIELRRAIF